MKATAVAGLIVSTAAPAYLSQDPFGVGKDLRASAAYEEAPHTGGVPVGFRKRIAVAVRGQ